MAMQPAGSVPLPSAQVVGNAFVEQYYHILHQSPEVVHKFYTDSSILSRPDPVGSMISVTTQQAINEKIQSMDYKNYKVEIKTADAQDSHQAGVVVLVTGCLTGTDNVRKKFTQMFFLAPQEKGYFVLNDVFRFVEESESSKTAPAPAPAPAPTADIPSTEPLITTTPDTSLAIPSQVAAAPEVDDVENGPEVCDPSENEGSVLEEEVVVDEPHSKPTENETVTVTSGNPEEKKSYASIVKVSKATTGATTAYVPTGSARVTPVKANNQRTRAPPETASLERQAPVPADESAPESGNNHEEGYSIYIRNMPQNATVQQLEEIFKKFGSIKNDGIQVRSNKQASCFGFVEFESLESMQNAIKASPINIGGRQAVVEEKRTNTRVGSSSSGRLGGGGGGRYPTGGRGGGWYRNESFRGGRGGNFGGGRGYGGGRTDFRNQGGEYSNRPRGGGGGSGGGGGRSIETYQRVDQTASGRSNSQGGGNKKNTTTTTTAA